ncbi:caspase family protein [Streptomyces asoensis]|uniref:Caspase family protein n=1 Tax=Streptomyces asoensis TaxID=249586 RepID=A0A6M4WU59_9ACTN|nr:caspase family protein [Streptomyces asoensis]QJS99882.1 caspase family protein [Streptomyces asoensis]
MNSHGTGAHVAASHDTRGEGPGVPDEEVLRRHFVAIATGEYDDPHLESLAVGDEVRAMREWLCAERLNGRRFRCGYPELAANPTKRQIRDALEEPPADEEWRDSDAAVVFVTGHGLTADGTHYLILKTTDTSKVGKTAFRTADLIGWLAETRIRHLLLILDACHAGRVALEAQSRDAEPPDTWVVLPSATRNQKAVTGALTGAISALLAELASPQGEKYGHDPYLTVNDFLAGVQYHLGDGQLLDPLYGSRRDRPHLCLPNPHYRADPTVEVRAARHDLALDRRDLETHWGPRSRGVANDGQQGWLFTGRADLMRELIAAATGAPGATIVTGGAGSGKSAVLARLVTLSDEQFLDRHAADAAAVPAVLRPPPGAVDVAVVATGKLHTRILAQICHALLVPAPVGDHLEPTVEERLASWHTWLRGRRRPLTIVLDALDEAADPHALLREVLARLEPDPDAPRIRLLVGVRSLAANEESPHAPVTASDTAAMADTAQAALRARRIVVDQAPWWNQHDVVAYVDSILRNTRGSPYAVAPAGATESVATALGERAGRSFLIGRMAASSLAASGGVITADHPGWLAALGEGVLGVFRQDLHHSLPEPDDRRRAVVLLRAVAFAHGSGLPWRGIWPLVAHAVDDEGGYYGDAEIAWLLGSRLGAYLVTDREDDTTVYRLFHDLLRATLRDRWRELLRLPSG